MERTLVLLKPDTVQRAIMGEIISRFERAGFKIIGMKMIAPGDEHFHKHYEEISKIITRWGRKVYETNLAQMTEGPVVAIAIEGIEAVENVRKMVGKLDPKESAPGTIRGDYTHLTRDYANGRGGTLPNLVHASGSVEEAEKELALWFSLEELYNYTNVHEKIVHGRVPKNKKK